MLQRLLYPLLALCLVAQPALDQVSTPRAGVVRYANGSVYPVFGIAGTYVLGPKYLDAVDALSFSGQGGVLSQRGVITLLDSNLFAVSTFNSGESKPVLGIDSGAATAVAWLPGRRQLLYWNGSTPLTVTVAEGSLSDLVLSVSRASSDVVAVLLENASGSVEEILISLKTGNLLSRTILPGATGPSFRQGASVISSANHALQVSSLTTGAVTSIPLDAGDLSFERASADCLHLYAAKTNRHWLLHLNGAAPALFELPAAGHGR